MASSLSAAAGGDQQTALLTEGFLLVQSLQEAGGGQPEPVQMMD